MEPRNFVSVVPAAKKSQLGPIFFSQNIRVIYKLSVKKQETGQKTGKKPPKKVFLSAPLTNFYGQATKVANFRGLATKVANFGGPATKVGQRG